MLTVPEKHTNKGISLQCIADSAMSGEFVPRSDDQQEVCRHQTCSRNYCD